MTPEEKMDNVLAKQMAIFSIIDKSGWIPVAERLPKEGQRVLAYEKPDLIVVAEMHSRMPLVGGIWWSTDNGYTPYSVFPSHWMPLPAPPTDGK